MFSLLLVGGTGVLSSAVVAEAKLRGFNVTTITRGNRKLPQGVRNIVCDRGNYEELSKLLNKKYDAIIDFLCYTTKDVEDSYAFYSQYTKQYFFISSCAVYDTRIADICREESPKVLPMWAYSIEKWAAEVKLSKMARDKPCYYTIIRPCVTYDDTRIPYGISPQYGYHWTLCSRILTGKPIITWNKGDNRCNMMRVEDFAVGVVGLVGNPKAYNEAFNICGDETPSFREVLNIVEGYLNKKAVTIDLPVEFYAKQIPYRAGELIGGRSIDSYYSNEKIKSAVPEFRQTISIREGIFKTLDAYNEHNYEHGIDWKFDAETDRSIRNWCKQQGIAQSNYKLKFIDYNGTATMHDRYTYYDNVYHNVIWMRVVRQIINMKRYIF